MNPPIFPKLPERITRPIDLIVIHCSGTANGVRINTGTQNAPQVIDDWHRARSFKRTQEARQASNYSLTSIGYHYVIDLDGTILTGRSLNELGAHAQGFNRSSIGICLIGGKEREGKYTVEQWTALAQLVRALSIRLNIPLQMAERKSSIHNGICGHHDLSPDRNGNGLVEPFEWTKTCPGFDVEKWLKNGLGCLSGNIHVGTIK